MRKKNIINYQIIILQLHKDNIIIHINVAYNFVAQSFYKKFHSTRDNNVTHCCLYIY